MDSTTPTRHVADGAKTKSNAKATLNANEKAKLKQERKKKAREAKKERRQKKAQAKKERRMASKANRTTSVDDKILRGREKRQLKKERREKKNARRQLDMEEKKMQEEEQAHPLEKSPELSDEFEAAKKQGKVKLNITVMKKEKPKVEQAHQSEKSPKLSDAFEAAKKKGQEVKVNITVVKKEKPRVEQALQLPEFDASAASSAAAEGSLNNLHSHTSIASSPSPSEDSVSSLASESPLAPLFPAFWNNPWPPEGEGEQQVAADDDTIRANSPSSSRGSTVELRRGSQTPEFEHEYEAPDSPIAEDAHEPHELVTQSQSGRHIVLKTPMGARIYTKVEDPNKFVIYADPAGPQIYQQAGLEGVAVDEFESLPEVEAAPGQLPPETIFNADKVAFAKYPAMIQNLLRKGGIPGDLSLKDVEKIIAYRSKLEKGRRRGWKRYIDAATAMYRVGAVKKRYRHTYDDDFEAYRKKIQKKVRRDTLAKMKDLINVSAGVDKLDGIIRENLKTEWPIYSKDL